jgi:hypothetical protein
MIYGLYYKISQKRNLLRSQEEVELFFGQMANEKGEIVGVEYQRMMYTISCLLESVHICSTVKQAIGVLVCALQCGVGWTRKYVHRGRMYARLYVEIKCTTTPDVPRVTLSLRISTGK